MHSSTQGNFEDPSKQAHGVPIATAPTVDLRGMSIPALGMGTWQLQGRDCQKAVETALRLGYRHIDTAQAYENEGDVGIALRHCDLPRDAYFVTTKVWYEKASAAQVKRSTHESVKRLGLDHVDLLLLHWPNDAVDLEETLGAMTVLVEEKVVHHIGVSNFTPRLLNEARRIAPISCLQVEYHPFLGQRPLRTLCEEHDIALTAYSPLARGEVLENETLKSIGEAHGKSAGQVALRWLMDQQNVVAIPKASSEKHLRANLGIFDFTLTADDMSRIDALECGKRLIDPGFAPDWQN